MRKEYYIAMKKLPKDFIDSGTVCVDTLSAIVAVNPKLHPIIFTDKEKRWKKLIFKNKICKTSSCGMTYKYFE